MDFPKTSKLAQQASFADSTPINFSTPVVSNKSYSIYEQYVKRAKVNKSLNDLNNVMR